MYALGYGLGDRASRCKAGLREGAFNSDWAYSTWPSNGVKDHSMLLSWPFITGEGTCEPCFLIVIKVDTLLLIAGGEEEEVTCRLSFTRGGGDCGTND